MSERAGPSGAAGTPTAVGTAAAAGPAAAAGSSPRSGGTAVVLGGGGVLGAVQVGMLAALADAGVAPDLVLGTSVGALNGALLAALPPAEAAVALERLWASPEARTVFAGGPAHRLRRLAVGKLGLHSRAPLRRALTETLGARRIEDLPVRFSCCAADIEAAAEHWFTEGPLVDAVLASAAVPGLLAPARVGGRQYMDGGLVNSIPLGRAVELGASRVFVLQVGRVDQPLAPPRHLWEVALVAFEIARRHRYARDLAAVPDGVEVHVLPVGDGGPPKWNSAAALRYRDVAAAGRRIVAARDASARYLDTHLNGRS